jgi:hypothetical protein
MSNVKPPPRPIAVDLDVFKRGGEKDPVHREDVERALYALTGWDKPQELIDQAMDVIDSYSWGVTARVLGDEPVRLTPGHHFAVREVAVAVPTLAETEQDEEQGDESDVETMELSELAPLSIPHEDIMAALDVLRQDEKPAVEKPPSPRRYGLAYTPSQLVNADPSALSAAQVRAREVLLLDKQRCVACEVVKPLSEFHVDGFRLTGLVTRCKPCVNKARNAARQIQRDQEKARKARHPDQE